MKKVFTSILALLAGFGYASAQTTGAVVTTVPFSFTAQDNVKVIVDVSAVGNLAGREPLYIWTWMPSDAAPGNGAWENSNEARKMVKEGPNRWSWTFKPSTYYAKSPAEITEIQFLVKAKDGSGDKKTTDIILKVNPLIYVPKVFRVFPAILGQNEVTSIYLDQTLATDEVTQRMTPATATISIWNGATQVDVTKTITLVKQGDRQFSYTFLPTRLFTVPNGVQLSKMVVIYKGKGRDANGNEINVESPPFEYGFVELK